MSMMETYRGTVYPWHCDHMDHMNVMWYVGKFDEATWNLFAHLGMPPSRMRASNCGMAAVDQRVSYQQELHAGDTVAVRSGVLEVKEKSLRFFHEMRDAATGDISAITQLVAVHMNTVERRSCGLPEDVQAKARELVVSYELPWTA